MNDSNVANTSTVINNGNPRPTTPAGNNGNPNPGSGNGNSGNGNGNSGNNGNPNPDNGNGGSGNNGNSNPPEPPDDCEDVHVIENCVTNRIEFTSDCGNFYSLNLNLICLISIYKSETLRHTLVLCIDCGDKVLKFYTNKRNKCCASTGGAVFLSKSVFINLINVMKLEYSDFSDLT